MRTLHIDIETFSSADLIKGGVYAYVNAPDFEILLVAYAFDDEAVKLIDLTQEPLLPEAILKALYDEKVIKTAFNASFEITCLNAYLSKQGYPPLLLNQWQCELVRASYYRLNGSLDTVGKALNLSGEEKKNRIGKSLIAYFSLPCKPTKTNCNRLRNLPEHAPEKWELFKAYCMQDVVAERAISKRLGAVPPSVWQEWVLDQIINQRGVRIDLDLVERAIRIDEEKKENLTQEAQAYVDNPQSIAQLKKVLETLLNEAVDSLNKETVERLLSAADVPPEAKKLLEIRRDLGKSSTAKYKAMLQAVSSEDERVRGLFQFYGASNTGRWAGRLVQVQNLPRGAYKEKELHALRYILKHGSRKDLEDLGNLPIILSSLIRTAFIPKEKHRLIVSDFSAIEARVIAWLSGEKWRMEVFKADGKIYEASASKMFHVPIDTIVPGHKNYALRQKGKVAELALGYQGGTGALLAMGAGAMGLGEEELKNLVDLWRKSSPHIVKLWETLERACIYAIKTGAFIAVTDYLQVGRTQRGVLDVLTISLPSGRHLYFPNPEIQKNKWGREQIVFSKLEKGVWVQEETYGGKLTENVVQAIARDCLAHTMLRLEQLKYAVVMHVHDEVVLEVPEGQGSLEEVNRILSEPIPWAKGLLLKAAGFESNYYRKD